jgi:hypothetical protein
MEQVRSESIPSGGTSGRVSSVMLMLEHGLGRLREPYVKHLEGRLWEMRMKGRMV